MAEAPIIVQGSGERENAVLKRLTCLLLMLAHAAGASSPPNVVLIVADDLGFTDLGSMEVRFLPLTSTALEPRGCS